MRPGLVSVMMPCYDAAATLPMALASLSAQTYPDWEAVIVDDGSRDATPDLLAAWRDPRVRVERFPDNRGRGAARQRCLELARGGLLAFMDADDWYFPRKLERQSRLMAERPGLTVLSGSCVITGADGRAVGLSRLGAAVPGGLTTGRFTRPGPPPLNFPPSMVRMEAARASGFNAAFRRSQDKDFLIRALLGREYAVLDEPLYAYSQAQAASLDKTLEGYRYQIRGYAQHYRSYPLSVAWEVSKTLGRIAAFRAAGLVGAEGRLIARRWGPLTPEAAAAYQAARDEVSRLLPGARR